MCVCDCCFSALLYRFSRATAAADYENLMETSFTDSNRVKTNVLPRWERKKLERAALAASGGGGATNSSTSDRFIPSRSGLELAKQQQQILLSRSTNTSLDSSVTSENGDPTGAMLAQQQRQSGTEAVVVVAQHKKELYQSNLSSTLLGVEDVHQSRILSYQDKAPAPAGDTISNLHVLYSASASAASRVPNKGSGGTKLVSRHIPSQPSRVLDAPDLLDDYYLNLVDWSDTNWLAIALGQTVYLWNAETGDIDELCTFDEGPNAHIASVAWVQEGGAHLAVGTSNGQTELWDVVQSKKLRSMDGHTDRVGALSWNRHLLTSGSRDTSIVHHDVRIAGHNVATLRQHQQEVCGLKWSPDGETLASGANDNLLCLWDAARSQQPRHRITDHQAAVKALAWSPHERHLLASGAGTADRTIKFWNASTGALLNSIDTGSQVCALLWNPYEKEIVSSHGFARNQISLWKYPSMAKIRDLEGHTSRVLHLACGPTGTVLSAAGDETLRFWDVFAPPPSGKTSKSSSSSLQTTKAHWTMQIR